MKSVTVVAPMFRPGGWDILLYGLARQTYEDFDLVVPDERYTKRHQHVLEFANFFHRPLYHVPLHRQTGPWNHPATAVNTGLILATGELVILLTDFAYVPPDWIEQHVRAHFEPRLVMGRHRYIPEPSLRGGWYQRWSVMTPGEKWPAIWQRESFPDEVSILREPFNNPGVMHVQGSLHGPGQPGDHGYAGFYGANASFPLKAALDIGGMDESQTGWHEFSKSLIAYGLQGWGLTTADVVAYDIRQVLPEVAGEHFRGTHAFGVAPDPFAIYELRKRMWAWRGLSLTKEPVLYPAKSKIEG